MQLAGYLLAKHWKVSPEYYTMEDYAQLDRALPGDAFLLIGDKVFDYEGRFAYSYDLAAEWKKATRLPFAFAVWIARKGVDPDPVSYTHLVCGVWTLSLLYPECVREHRLVDHVAAGHEDGALAVLHQVGVVPHAHFVARKVGRVDGQYEIAAVGQQDAFCAAAS